MKLLTPLGLLGLIGIIVLIIIYIIRPNFQQKNISSTFIWKLSLKYKKKRIPTSKLRDFLLILCQILILASCAAILTKPSQIIKVDNENLEVITVIDMSASMRVESDGKTRFERAVEQAAKITNDCLNKGGVASVLLAGKENSFLIERATSREKDALNESLNSLLEDDYYKTTQCSYGVGDVNGAIALTEDLVMDNPSAQLYVFSDKTYNNVPDTVNYVNVSHKDDWNVAILDASARLDENYYEFTVKLASYGRDRTVTLTVELTGANAYDENDDGSEIVYEIEIDCPSNVVQTVIFKADYSGVSLDSNTTYVPVTDNKRAFSYKTAYVTVDVEDCFLEDNTFALYGGQKEVVRIQYYAGNMANPFFRGVLQAIQKNKNDNYEIVVYECRGNEQPALMGYDFYIFEHYMPETAPFDGFVMYVNPSTLPSSTGVRLGQSISASANRYFYATTTQGHPIMNNVNGDGIEISMFTSVTRYDSTVYDALLWINNYPILLAEKNGPNQTFIMTFSVHYSNFVLTKDFPLMINNIFDYYFPMSISSKAIGVDTPFVINQRGEKAIVTGNNDYEEIIDKFTPQMTYTMPGFSVPGTYVVEQETFFGVQLRNNVFVQVPVEESNIFAVEDMLDNPYVEMVEKDYYNDLLLYVAAALVALLFIEWWLKSRQSN